MDRPNANRMSVNLKNGKVPYARLYGTNNKVILVKGEIRDDSFNNKDRSRPDDQLDLKESDLTEDIGRFLTAKSQQKSLNIIRFDYKEKKFKQVLTPDESHIHLDIIGNLIPKETDEARLYEEKQKILESNKKNFYSKNLIDEFIDSNGKKTFRILKNNFNFYDRATQTANNPFKDVAIMTDAPMKVNFSDYVTPAVFYHVYSEDYSNSLKLKEKKPNKALMERMQSAKKKRVVPSVQLQKNVDSILNMINSTKLVERMINQNLFDEITQDFKYFEDESDFYKKEGTLLPLWKFSNQLTKKMWITSVCWNKKYTDLFAVSTGPYEFFGTRTGLIVLFSLKNPSFYEVRIDTDSGCMSLDFHPERSYLLCAGFYDGSVSVYDLRKRHVTDKTFCIKAKENFHSDPVWQVQWQENDVEDNPTFCSISSDGRVIVWTLKNLNLTSYDLIVFDNEIILKQCGESTVGTCFDLNTKLDNTLIMGSESGKIFECSKSHQNQILTQYDAHLMSVYSIKWNAYHKRIFISGSADWSVRIWDHQYKDPILTFELNGPVVDVAWAPYSSTVFAAITLDGYVYFYDIVIDNARPLCVQNVFFNKGKRKKLTHLAFSPTHPIILITDDRGWVYSFKISPNLRSVNKESKINSIQIIRKENFEILKMKQCLTKEMDPGQEMAVTTRIFIDIDQRDIKKSAKNQEDAEEKEKEKDKDKNASKPKSAVSKKVVISKDA